MLKRERMARHAVSEVKTLAWGLVAMMCMLLKTCQSFQDHSTCGRQMNTLPGRLPLVGGTAAQAGEWPWQAQMIWDGESMCGGSLVHPQWILTAAHCLDTILTKPDFFEFKLGTTQYSGDSPNQQVRTAEKIFMHPNYTIYKTDNNYDVALIRVNASFELTRYVQTVCVPTADMDGLFPEGTQVTVTGWGSTGDDSNSDELLEITVPIVNQSDCARAYDKEDIPITEYMICAGEMEGGKDSCQGDSGGPMVNQQGDQWFQVGVVSFGIGCALAEFPGVYVRMTAFQDWIAPVFDGGEPAGQDSMCSDRGQYRCKYGGCIPYSAKCDGQSNCYTKSDEEFCEFPLMFFDATYDTLLDSTSVSRQEFVPSLKDCASLCLVSAWCVAFDAELGFGNEGYLCSLAGPGYATQNSASDIVFVLGKFQRVLVSAPETDITSDARHGLIGFPVQLADPATAATVITWTIEPKDTVNTIDFHFTAIQTDEAPAGAIDSTTCNNYLTVRASSGPPNEETFCLFKSSLAGDSIRTSVKSDSAVLVFNTNNIAANGFVAEYNAEWRCNQTIEVTDTGGEITSPNYPNAYPPFLDCQIGLKAPYGRQVMILIEDFDSNICLESHFFRVIDQTRDPIPPILIDCNSTISPSASFVTTEGEMRIIFTSDEYSIDDGTGFRLMYALSDTGPVPPEDPVDILRERNAFRSALIGVSIGAGLVIIILIVGVIFATTALSKARQPRRNPTVRDGQTAMVTRSNPREDNIRENRTLNI